MIGIRVDANSHIASGHLFRCLSIAEQIRRQGEDCMFFLGDESFTELLEEKAFPYEVLDLTWNDWNRGTDVLIKALAKHQISCLIVDSYYVTESFFEKLFQAVKIFYLDDFCKTRYQVSATLHISEWKEDHIIKDLYQGSDVEVYSGMQYVPMKADFGDSVSYPVLYDYMITTGGTDTYHITLKLLEKMLEDTSYQDKTILAVLGKMNTDAETIFELSKKHPSLTVMQNISNMAEVMKKSRMGVCAGGNTPYEFMATKTPFVCFGFSDDQDAFGKRMAEHGMCPYAGDARRSVSDVVNSILSSFQVMNNLPAGKLQALAEDNYSHVDARGSERIAKIVIQLAQK